MTTRTIALILTATFTSASADPQAPLGAATDATAPVRNAPKADHDATTRAPVTVDTGPGGRVRVVVDNRTLVGDDVVCLTTCAPRIDGRPVAEPMSRQ